MQQAKSTELGEKNTDSTKQREQRWSRLMLCINYVNQRMWVWERSSPLSPWNDQFLKLSMNQKINSVLGSLSCFLLSPYWLFLLDLVLRWEYGIVQFFCKALGVELGWTLWQPTSRKEYSLSSLWQPRRLNPFGIKDKERHCHDRHLDMCKSNTPWGLELGTKLQDLPEGKLLEQNQRPEVSFHNWRITRR